MVVCVARGIYSHHVKKSTKSNVGPYKAPGYWKDPNVGCPMSGPPFPVATSLVWSIRWTWVARGTSRLSHTTTPAPVKE